MPWGRGAILLVRSAVQDVIYDYKEGERDVQEGLKYLVSPMWLGYSYEFLGSYRMHFGDIVNAEKYFKDSIQCFLQINHQQGLVFAYNSLSTVFLKRKDFTQAQLYLQNACEIARRIGHRQGLRNSLLRLAILSEAERDYESAQHYCMEHLKVTERQTEETTRTMCCLGRVTLSQHNEKMALCVFIDALKLSVKIIDEATTTETIAGIANYFIIIGNIPTALQLLYFVQSHPACAHDTNEYISNLLTSIGKNVSLKEVSSTQQEIRSWKLDKVVSMLLDELTALKEQNGW